MKSGNHEQSSVAVVGTPAMDLVAKVNALPHRDGLASAERFEPFPGGAGANVAVGIARLGGHVAFLGKLGNDDYGQLLLKAFEDEGINTRGVRIADRKRTVTCFIAVGPMGERMIIALGGDTLMEEASELDVSLLQEIRALYLTDVPTQVASAAMEVAREEGGFVFFSPGGLLISGGLEPLRPLLALADAVVISQAELSRLLGKSPVDDAARSLAAHGPGVVVVTMGAEGVLVLHENMTTEVEAFVVDEVLDTTGAGDAFAAGLIVGFLDGMTWSQSARLGCAAAAIKIRHLGARSGLPTRPQVDELMQSPQGGAL